jgi:hypothetical protein
MKYLMKRPSLFVWAVALAMLFARAGHGGHGFHQW